MLKGPETTFAASAQYQFGASASVLDLTLLRQDGTRDDSNLNFFQTPPRTVSPADNGEYSRKVHTSQQAAKLEHEYSVCNFARPAHRREIARRISVDEIKLRTWFKNRRTKVRKNASVNECKENSLIFINADSHFESHQQLEEYEQEALNNLIQCWMLVQCCCVQIAGFEYNNVTLFQRQSIKDKFLIIITK